ncbi:MAG: biotin--[acetyl-CoA-carboxylase] ligase [Candidatus Omnitrophica bacterium]|nr:biotin--[acetyl-CoA-carboxylase] ligase [Candidatus Omnitrophota bacterium]
MIRANYKNTSTLTVQERILEFLRKKDNYVSGDYIAQRLGVSRQALWKHIQGLKDMGYEILAVPHLGYRLEAVPDRLFTFEVKHNLNTQFVGRRIRYFDRVASTMDAAVRAGHEGSPEGTVIIAESQSKGRGRLGRQWVSPKYKGIYLSVILRPRIMPSEASILTLIAAVSLCDVIKEETGLEARIKWPNDILLGRKKVGGILTELNGEMDRVHFVVIGIGINVNSDKRALAAGATSLKEQCRHRVGRLSLLQAVLRQLEKDYLVYGRGGVESLCERWREHSLTLGRRVRVVSRREEIDGEAVDIESDGGLLIRQDSGVTRKVTSGDVSLAAAS